MTIYDGLADVFTGSLGEPVIYTPLNGAPKTISAIWTEETLDISVPGDGAHAIDQDRRLCVSETDVPSPADGDTAQRVATGQTLTITQPIKPDGRGMIVCMLRR